MLRLVEGVEWDEIIALRRSGAAARARAAERPRAGPEALAPAVAARTDRHAGGLGGGRYLLPQPHGPDGGGESGRRRRFLRPRLQRAASRAVLQGHGAAGRRSGPAGARPERLALERARARARPGDQRARPHHRLHHRQRHERARHRRREPALSAAGQGLRRELRAGPVRAADERRAAARHARSSSRFGAPTRSRSTDRRRSPP